VRQHLLRDVGEAAVAEVVVEVVRRLEVVGDVQVLVAVAVEVPPHDRQAVAVVLDAGLVGDVDPARVPVVAEQAVALAGLERRRRAGQREEVVLVALRHDEVALAILAAKDGYGGSSSCLVLRIAGRQRHLGDDLVRQAVLERAVGQHVEVEVAVVVVVGERAAHAGGGETEPERRAFSANVPSPWLT
jgi:hypothetical protein